MVKPQLSLKQQLRQPVISDLLRQRSIGWATLGAGALHFSLVAAGLPGWRCPFLHVLGLPCPGCGLSRAIIALTHGDWLTSLNYHALAVPVLLLVALLIAASLLPGRPRRWLIDRIGQLEQRWAVAVLGVALLFGYWLGRLLLIHDAYVSLIID